MVIMLHLEQNIYKLLHIEVYGLIIHRYINLVNNIRTDKNEKSYGN